MNLEMHTEMNTQIITITDAAAAHIQKMLANNKKAAGFRLSMEKTGCSGYSYKPEIVLAKKPGDMLVNTAQGIDVFLDTKVIEKLKGTVIDYVQKSLGASQLVYSNPGAKGACGCGESFNFAESGHHHE